MAASTYLAQVQQLYIAYFGRPADPIGLQYWATQIDAANGSIAAVQAGFSASAESTALFGNKSSIDKVTAIYLNAFGRSPEPAGLAYWVAQLDSGKVTQAQASWTIQQSAGAGDAAAVQNKLTAAQAFTAAITTTAQIQGYQGAGAAAVGVAFLATVNQNNASATAAVAAASTAVANAVAAGGTVGSTLALTAGVDTLTGTAGNDTFVADNTSATTKFLSASDTINGGAGTDTLKVFLANADTTIATPTLNSVEIVQLVGGSFVTATPYTAIAGTTGLIIDTPIALGATYNVAGQAVTLKGFSVANAGTGSTVIGSTADTAANVTLNGWTSVGTGVNTVDLSGTKVATATLTATGANSSIALTNSGLALKTLNIAGDKNIAVATDAATTGALTSINASTATGAVTANLIAGNTVAGFTFTGGAGNDTVILGATELTALTAGSQLNGGAGTDTLVINNTAALVATDYAKLNAAVGFEVLGLGNAQTVDASQLTAIKSFAVTVTGDIVQNLGAGSSVSITQAAGAPSIAAVNLGAAVGNAATEVTVGGTAGATTVTNLTVTGLTTLGLTSTGTAANVVGLTNSDNTAVTVKGATDLTLTLSTATTTGSKVDASAFTGKLTVTGTNLADVIIGGSGADTINASLGGDTITTGAGADKVVFTAIGQASSTALTTITDFTAGTDKLVVTGLVGHVAGTTAFTTTAVNVSAATTFAQALDLASAADGGTNTQVKYFQFQSNTYVVVDNSAGNTFVAGTDGVIKLSGALTLAAADVTIA